MLSWDKITAWSSDDRDLLREVAAHRTLAAQRQDDEAPPNGQRYILG